MFSLIGCTSLGNYTLGNASVGPCEGKNSDYFPAGSNETMSYGRCRPQLHAAGIVAMIMMRTLRRDLNRDNSAEEKEELLVEELPPIPFDDDDDAYHDDCVVEGHQRWATQPAVKDPAHYRAVLDVLWTHFGSKRLVYGSNWPCTKHSGSYASFLKLVASWISSKGPEAREDYYWRNSATAYRLPLK